MKRVQGLNDIVSSQKQQEEFQVKPKMTHRYSKILEQKKRTEAYLGEDSQQSQQLP